MLKIYSNIPQKQSPNKIELILNYLHQEIEVIIKKRSMFGYKERMTVERGLFLLLKRLCKEALNYDLQGFGNYHHEVLNGIIKDVNYDETFARVIEQIFQLKIFIQSVTCENPYVTDNSLLNLDLNNKKVASYVENQIKIIANKILH